ncbi:MAG: epoxyqueuosine reductase QueH [bacterium]
MQKILVHICCGPCYLYPYRILNEEGFTVMGYFFNPNIHPFLEFKKRADTVKQLESQESRMGIIYDETYDLEKFLQSVAFREDSRCIYCYHMRLKQAVITARHGKFDCFSTTLLYSKFQKHEIIREIAESLAKQYHVPFLYRDFREGWKEGIERSKKLELYRQPYCGCIYSERDRYCQDKPSNS